jgi:hypothetical protein
MGTMAQVGTIRRPSRAVYGVAALVAVVGLFGAVVWAVVSVTAMNGRIADYTRVEVPGERVLTVQEPTILTIYYEAPGIASGRAEVPPLTIAVTDPDGDTVTVAGYGYEYVYETGAHSGRALGTFPATAVGDYRVAVEGEAPPMATIAVGEDVDGFLLQLLGAGLLVLGAFGVAAIIALVVAYQRHRSTPAPLADAAFAPPAGAEFAPPPPLPPTPAPPPPPPVRVPANH